MMLNQNQNFDFQNHDLIFKTNIIPISAYIYIYIYIYNFLVCKIQQQIKQFVYKLTFTFNNLIFLLSNLMDNNSL